MTKTKFNKLNKKIIAFFLAIIMAVLSFPFSASASVNYLPEEMQDNSILRALEYIGYDVQGQKDDSNLFKVYGYMSGASQYARTGISYNSSTSTGLETVSDGSTITGRAPAISTFRSRGLCCGSFVSYFLLNYMPNIEGVDTDYIESAVTSAGTPRSPEVWNSALNTLANRGQIDKVNSVSQLDPGDVIVFRSVVDGSLCHVAIYAGTYDGEDFIIHMGNDRGPEISTVADMNVSSAGDKQSRPYAYYHIPGIFEQLGRIEVYKKDTDGNNLSGAGFVATNNDTGAQFRIGPTNSSGYAFTQDVVPYGTYTVRETIFPTNYHAYGQTSWTVTVSSANDGVVTINAVNEIDFGHAKIIKTSEDGEVAGITFTLTGNGVTRRGTTNSEGELLFEDLKPGNYTVTEESIDKYVQNEPQTVTVRPNETTEVNFNNILKKFRVNATKTDIETGNAQGDATLAGAVYGIYQGDELIDTYTTDANGQFTTKYYICCTNWTIKEITPSEGYLLNDTVYKVGADPQLYTIELNDTSNDVDEQVIKGQISLIKHTDDGSTQIETPEEGAQFEVYLKSAGSYENAVDTERDLITCDADGFAETKLLPYGTYTVHQVKGWEGKDFIADFDVFINEDGHVYKFLINNRMFESYIKVVKADAETGKTIPYAGAAFEIYDEDGNQVTMQFTYPEVTKVSTFYTNEEGTLITPETLKYGKYTLVEVQAPYGYVLDSTPIPFNVERGNSTEEDGITIINITANDMPQKGVIEINKTGEIFATISENGGIYTPVYQESGLANSVFEIYAAEDIITPEGTVRAQKGDLVDTIATDSDGFARSKELYLGKYTVIEKTATEGYFNSHDTYEFELTYQGQEIEVTTSELYLTNERQTVKVDLEKAIETDDVFNIGNNGEIETIQFGIFAGEDVTAADGSVIPAGSMVVLANCDENGHIDFQCDLPIGFDWYVQEVSADAHYIISDTKYTFNTDYQGQDVLSFDIHINNGEPIENEIKRGDVKGLKVDDEGYVRADAVIGLFASDETEFTEENAILVTTSDANGAFEFKDIPYGEYIVREITAPYGTILDTTSYPVNIYDDEVVVEINITNKVQKGIITINKTGEVLVSASENNGVFTPVYEEIGLPGIMFEIVADEDILAPDGTIRIAAGEVVDTVTTDENGKAQSIELYLGKYTVKELNTPEKFVENTTIYNVELAYAGQEVELAASELNVLNIRQKIAIDLTKEMVMPKVNADPEAYKNVKFGVYADEDITNYLGEIIITKGSLVGYITIDENGKGVLGVDLPVGFDFYTKEDATDSKYILDDGVYEFSTKLDNQDQEINTIVINDGKAIVNNYITGYVEFKKVDEDNADIELVATYALYTKDGQLIETKESKVGEWVRFEGLPVGDYYLQEIASPDGYILSDAKYEFSITPDSNGETIQIIAKDTAETPDIVETGMPEALTGVVAFAGIAFACSALYVLLSAKKRKNAGK